MKNNKVLPTLIIITILFALISLFSEFTFQNMTGLIVKDVDIPTTFSFITLIFVIITLAYLMIDLKS